MKTFGFNLISLALCLSVAACTVTGKPYQEHQEDQRDPKGLPEIIAKPESITPSTETAQWDKNFQTAKDPLKEVILPLADRVLSPAVITAKTTLLSRANMDELREFNKMILQLPKEQRSRPEFQALLKRYEAAMETECGDYISSCSGLKYFRMSANSEQIAKLIAENDNEHYFRMLEFAIELKNVYWDPDIPRMLFANPAKNLSTAEAKRRDSVKNMMGTALQSARNKNQSPADTRAFLDSINAWKFADTDASSFDETTQSALYEMIAGSHYMYEGNSRTALHPDFKAIISRAEAQPDGFFAAQHDLHERQLFSTESIGAVYIQHFDELYFIIDSVFQSKIPARVGAELFASTTKTSVDLQNAVQNYMRIRFLLALNQSSELAKTIFNASVQGQDLLFHFMRESASVAMVWSTFTGKTSPVRNFAIAAARTRGDVSTERRLASLFDSIQTSINLTSAYPHELVLFHLLSQKRFTLVVPFSGRKYDSGDLMRLLFQGKIDPLVVYTSQSQKLNQYQLVYAFDMGLRTNLFKTVNIDPDFFIADTLRRLNGVAMDGITKGLAMIQTRFNQTPSYSKFKSACAEFSGKPVSRNYYFMEVEASPYYGRLMTDAFRDVSDGSESGTLEPGVLLNRSMGIYYMDRNYSELIEQARVDLGGLVRLGNAMLIAYRGQLRQAGLSAEEIEKKTQLARTAIAEMDGTREKVLKISKSWLDDIGSCYWKAYAKDTETQMRVIDAETAYLRQVHRDIKKLRSGATPAEKAAIEERIKFKGLPSGFQGTDKISSDAYLYGEVDLKIRVAKYLTEGLKTDEVAIAPLAPGLTIDYGNRLDVDVAFIRDSKLQPIPFMEDMDEFVTSALKAGFNGTHFGKDVYLLWVSSPNGNIINWSDYLKSLVSLYHLEHEVRGQNTDFTGLTILQGHEEVLSNLKMSPKERQIYSLIYVNKKYDPLYLGDRLLKYNVETQKIMDYWGLFDFPVKLMDEEVLGSNYDVNLIGEGGLADKRFGPFSSGQMYYSARANENRGTTIIPYNQELDRQLDAEMFKYVNGDSAATRDFHNLTVSYINDVAKRPVDQRPRADINIYTTLSAPLLTDTLVPSYNSKQKLFNITTDNCFVSDKTCPSFQQ